MDLAIRNRTASALQTGSLQMMDMHDQGTLRVFATILGRGLDTPYALVEDAKADQFVVTPAMFE
ncbi:MAG: hypothetical protein Q7J82_08560 [Coriobacteriia bacterium]|nr:hypothetical protein [Coriobacteriia bacterium]